jgi:hypothetical protein
MLRSIDYCTGEEVWIPDWVVRLVSWLLEALIPKKEKETNE